MAKTIPSYNIFPGDMLAADLSNCTLEAQGLWTRLEYIMHMGERYGYLQFDRKPMDDVRILRRIGCSPEEYQRGMESLEKEKWIVREPQTRIIYSEMLVAQEEKRTGVRDRKRASRANQAESEAKAEPKSDESGAKVETFSEESQDSVSVDYSSKSLSSQSVGHNSVTPLSHTPNGKGKGEGEGKGSVPVFSSSLHSETSEVLHPLSPYQSAAELASEQVRELRASSGTDREWDQAAMVEEIALASPAAAAGSWTAMSIHGNHAIGNPIVDAICLEAREQGTTEQASALWLLRQVRLVSLAVMREAGWQRFWTVGRTTRFFKNVEYRNLEVFNKDSTGGSNGKRSKTAGNEANLRAALAESNARRGDAGVADDALRGAGQGTPAPSVATVPRGDDRANPRAVPDSVHKGVGDVHVLPKPVATPELCWPS